MASNSFKMRLYSSVHDEGSTKPWSSTGYTASSQFSLCNSMSRWLRRVRVRTVYEMCSAGVSPTGAPPLSVVHRTVLRSVYVRYDI